MTNMSDISVDMEKPDSSVEVRASTCIEEFSNELSTGISDVPAIAAVPWPITRIRRIDPLARRALIVSGNVNESRSGTSKPLTTSVRPRMVLRKLRGASVISFSRKCGASPRSMSRVVTSATATSLSVTGISTPSYARRVIPSIVPAPSRRRRTICPRE
ncbi:unannotated protein [freshwater metagenome]|uniref:Unannotated protein n=1 Tax=freshwater metagenome TaxID=449393 RepID=A0A6J7TWH6_9ZZZZ